MLVPVKIHLQNHQRDFKNKEEALESVDSRGTELVNMCKDELGQTSARIKLSDLNESWGDALSTLSVREEKLGEGLALAHKYQVCCSCCACTIQASVDLWEGSWSVHASDAYISQPYTCGYMFMHPSS